MKNKRIVSLIMTLCILLSIFPINTIITEALSEVYTDTAGNTALLEETSVAGKYALTLHFAKSYGYLPTQIVDGMNVSTDDSSLNGRIKLLLSGAVAKYNADNGTSLTTPSLNAETGAGRAAVFTDVNYSITELTITTAADAYITKFLFNTILPADGFVNLEKIDISGMNITNGQQPTSSANWNILNNSPAFANESAAAVIKYYTNATTVASITGNRTKIYEKLHTILLPENLVTLGSHTMRNIPALKEIALPDSIKTMGHYVFAGCSNLTKVKLPSQLQSYGLYEGVYYYNFDVNALNVDWTFHGVSLNDKSRAQLMKDINSSKPSNVDLRGSNIVAADLLLLTNTQNLQSLNVMDCEALNGLAEGSEDYNKVESYLYNLRSKGITVHSGVEIIETYTDGEGNTATLTANGDGTYALSLHFAKAYRHTGLGLNAGKNHTTNAAT